MSAVAFIICMLFAFPRLLGGWLAEVRHTYDSKLDALRNPEATTLPLKEGSSHE